MLSLLPITFLTLTFLPFIVFADQAIINTPNTAISSVVSSLSSLFTAKPTPTTACKPTFCCGDDCPPGACNINHIIPTDLAYAFPAPLSGIPAPPASPLKLPCCHANCPDGACRTTPVKASQRPTLTHPPKVGPSSQNVIVGCCKTCHNCDQAVTSIAEESLMRAARTDEAASSITASASLHDAAPVQKDKNFPHGPGGELLTRICAGCGTCYPCDFATIATWVEFYPHPTQNSEQATVTETASAKSTATAVTKGEEEAEPTIYLADEIVDGINGKNQDVLPIILQNGGSDGGIAGVLGATKKELRTVLASVDLKLSENYVSRRLLKQLGRLGDIVGYPKGVEESLAVISQDLDQVRINATIVLDIVAGAQDVDTRKLFRNVRFSVFGREDDNIVNADVGEIILGGKLLREINGLTVFGGVRDEVQEGVRVVEKGHFGLIQKGSEKERVEGEKHDEL